MLSSLRALQRTARIKCLCGGRKSVTLSFPERRANDWMTRFPWTFLTKTSCGPVVTGDHKILFPIVLQIQKCHTCHLKTHWHTLTHHKPLLDVIVNWWKGLTPRNVCELNQTCLPPGPGKVAFCSPRHRRPWIHGSVCLHFNEHAERLEKQGRQKFLVAEN